MPKHSRVVLKFVWPFGSYYTLACFRRGRRQIDVLSQPPYQVHCKPQYTQNFHFASVEVASFFHMRFLLAKYGGLGVSYSRVDIHKDGIARIEIVHLVCRV